MTTRTWLITGVSSGLGRALAEAVLARGERVIGTLRKAGQAEQFAALAPARSFACVVDLSEGPRVRAAIGEAIERAGGVDVVVNNAGYGLTGAAEEVSDAEARHQMETNFFGALSVAQAALPYLRRQRRGHIVNISSIAGVVGFGGLPLYCASKFALEGLGAALAKELRDLGIQVINVEPGAFRTNWRSADAIVQAARVIDDYASTVGAQRERLKDGGGQQEGDPAKAALAIIQAVDAPKAPLHLPLNPQAIALLRKTWTAALAELDEWESVCASTCYNESEPEARTAQAPR